MADDNILVEFLGTEVDLMRAFSAVQGAAESFGKFIMFNVGLANKAIDEFQEQELAETNVASVIEATGKAAGFTAEQMGELAKRMEDTTRFTDEAVLGAQAAIASMDNVRGDVFVDATKAAADMATVLGRQLKPVSLQLAKALQDPIKGVERMTRNGIIFTQSQKDMIETLVQSGDVMEAQRVILDKVNSEFGGAADAAGDNFGGAMAKLHNRVNDLWEAMGSQLVPAIEKVTPVVEAVILALENLQEPLREVIGLAIQWTEEFIKNSIPTLQWFAEQALTAFTIVQTALGNLGETFTLIGSVALLAVVQLGENIKHFFTVAIPGYLTWFARNWDRIFLDLFNATTYIFENMFKNIADFFTNVWKWLSGEETDWKWTGLLEGFEATLDELPQIAQRKKGEFEKSLEQVAGSSLGNLMDKFQKNYEANLDFINNLFVKKQREAIDLTDDADTENFELGHEGKGKRKKKDPFKATIEGLEALKNRIDQSSVEKTEVKGVDKLVENAEKQTVIAAKQAQTLDEINHKQKSGGLK